MQVSQPSVAALAALVPLAACASTGIEFESIVLHDAAEKLGGCAVGDLIPGRGDEIAVVAASGKLRVIADGPDGWHSVAAGRASGEMIQVATGDLWADVGGDELVAVGMANGDEDSGGEGAVFVAGYVPDAEGFVARPVFKDTALVHAVAVADFDPEHPGEEALVGGFSRALTLLRFEPDGSASAEEIGRTPAAAKGMVAFGDGAAVACNDGSLVIVGPGPTGWEVEVTFVAPAGLARLGTDGERLLAAADDGALWLVEGSLGVRIHDEALKLRGAVLTDLDPDSPGLEAATAGYAGVLTLLRNTGVSPWERDRLFRSDKGLHHLALGELDDADGRELVTVGYSGEVVLIRRR